MKAFVALYCFLHWVDETGIFLCHNDDLTVRDYMGWCLENSESSLIIWADDNHYQCD